MADEPDLTSKDEAKEISRMEREADAMSVPAVFIDEWASIYWRGHIRTALGESSPKTGRYVRFAMMMQAKDVRALIAHWQEVLDEIDPPPKPEAAGDGA